MNLLKGNTSRYAFLLSCAVLTWLTAPPAVHAATVSTKDVYVKATAAEEEAKFESQQKTIITKKDIEKKQAKSAEDIVFQETGVTRTVDSMGNVGVSIRGAEPRHTLILVDGQEALGGLAKYSGAGDELQRIGTENVDHIEIIQGAASAKYGSGAMGGVINVITTKPTKKAGLKFNVEGRRDRDTAQSTPGTNAYLRADSGKIGKISFALYGNKRDLLPIYSNRIRREVLATQEEAAEQGFEKNSLRFYGTNANMGLSMHYAPGNHKKLDVRADRYQENLERFIKRTTSYLEPQVHYKRDLTRNTGNIAYSDSNAVSDWKVELNYTRTKENDITLTSDYGNSTYEGKNTLEAVDTVNHGEWKGDFTINRQVNDKHLLSYGFGYAHEDGEGSRVRLAPKTYVRAINPYDYDKNIYVQRGVPSSSIHKYNLKPNAKGVITWNREAEYYNYHGEKNPPYDETWKNEISRHHDDLDNWGNPLGDTQKIKEMLQKNPDRYKAYSFVDTTKPWGYDTERKFIPQFTYEEWQQYLAPYKGIDPSSTLMLVGDSGTDTDKSRRSLFVRNPDAYYRYKAFNQTLINLNTAREKFHEYIFNKLCGGNEKTYQDYITKHPEADKPTIKDFEASGQLPDVTKNLGQKPMPPYYALLYYGTVPNFPSKYLKANGKIFKEEYNQNDNKQLVGKAALNKAHVFLQDTWQLNENTMLYPIIRLDHTNLFGNNVSFTMGVTHTLGGNVHRRFKANVGTSYTAPGLGELYYCWEMFGPHVLKANPDGSGTARLGWYWQGNPDLKPEKGFNVDISIEGENAKTYTKLTLFHNKIDNYMTLYNTGYLIDFHPEYDEHTNLGIFKYFHAPDRVYSFKNIGHAEITGVELEVKHTFNDHWQGRLGYTWLHAINKSDPTMPRQLLDKPQHKIDIGLEYENKKTGWSAGLWGDYYIHMLDSNSVAGNKNTLTTERIPDPTGQSQLDTAKVTYDLLQAHTVDMYQKKTFGTWNMIIRKKVNKDSLVYFGIDNLFNHRDDDRALSARTFRFGANFKLGLSAARKLTDFVPKELKGKISPLLLAGFLDRPFEKGLTQSLTFFGEYRGRWDSHLGSNRPAARVTESSTIADNAVKNLRDQSEHGFTQRLRLGLRARLTPSAQLTLIGSASGAVAPDTEQATATDRKLTKLRLDRADMTTHAAHLDFSVGRIQEKMGITGYWFNQSFDGARAVWTDTRNQLRIGFGDFKNHTGIRDSAYTHATFGEFYRTPTVLEFLGLIPDSSGYPFPSPDSNTHHNTVNFYRQMTNAMKAETEEIQAAKADWDKKEAIATKIWNERQDILQKNGNNYEDPVYKQKDAESDAANTASENAEAHYNEVAKTAYTRHLEAKLEVIRRMQKIAVQAYPQAMKRGMYLLQAPVLGNLDASPAGNPKDRSNQEEQHAKKTFCIPLSDPRLLQDGKAYIREWFTAHKAEIIKAYNIRLKAEKKLQSSPLFTAEDFETKDAEGKDFADKVYEKNFLTVDSGLGSENQLIDRSTIHHAPIIYQYYKNIKAVLTAADNNSTLPREAFEKVIGRPIFTKGNILHTDITPSLGRALYLQFRRQVNPRLGLTAWYLRSADAEAHVIRRADYTKTGTDALGHDLVERKNNTYTLRKLANILALGVKYQLNATASLSFDYGQNRSDWGRYMNGTTPTKQFIDPSLSDPEHNIYTSTFLIGGRKPGKNPKFFDIRFDFGRHDYRLPGSWSAFGDYKYFEHGAFFGGNGTEGLPDRYLDGVKSFTLGGAYVPRKNMLLEAYYTFDAQSTGKRDTLYGPEQFKLGNYTRLQLTYKF